MTTPVLPGKCVFCRIIDGIEPAEIVRRWHDAVAFVPLNPVTPGHILVVPVEHVWDATESPYVTGRVFSRAAEIMPNPGNLITSAGREATQSVFHLHVHIIPRRENDGLALPWYSGKSSKRAVAS